jgi:SSS family solute:Na+ symporter
MGSGMITGSANFIYTYGPISSIFHFIGEPAGLLLVALVLAKRVRVKEGYTVPQLIEEKLLSLIALALGTVFPSILSIQMYAYSMYGAAITPALVGSLFWDKATKQGGLASIIIGGASVLVWDVVLQSPMGWNSILVAGPLSILALIVVSLLTQNKTSLKEI